MSGIFIAGTGMYVPPSIYTNDDMSKLVETSDEWIKDRTGIKQRRFSTGEPNFYMGAIAAKQAIEDAGIDPLSIDMIIGSTITPDYCTPSLACLVQSEINADNAFCFDINAACSGFIYALDAAHTYLSSGKVKTVLIVCSENLSKIIDFTDRKTCVLFGDGAGAVVVTSGSGLFESYLKSEGKNAQALLCRALINTSPFVTEADNEKYAKYKQTNGSYITMDGRETYRFSTRALPEAIEAVCSKAGIGVDELTLIIPHQANLRIVKTSAEKLNIPLDKMFTNIDRYGNTSCASIPICLDELKKSGKLTRGDKIALAGFGGGLTYGGIVLEW
jgi:3-oxoacyl-[acyl-carrier-protein] synthase-3